MYDVCAKATCQRVSRQIGFTSPVSRNLLDGNQHASANRFAYPKLNYFRVVSNETNKWTKKPLGTNLPGQIGARWRKLGIVAYFE